MCHMHKLPRLNQSRHGVYYLRVIRNKVKTRRSLGIKDFRIARLFALRLNTEMAVSNPDFDPDKIRKLDIEVSPTGGLLESDPPSWISRCRSPSGFTLRPDRRALFARTSETISLREPGSFASFAVINSWRDLHPQECAHAGRT